MFRREIKTLAKEQIRGKIGVLFLIYLLTGAILSCANLLAVAGFFLAPAFALSMAKIYLKISEGEKPTVGEAFYGLEDLWRAFKANFLAGLFTALWSVVLIIPGFIKAISYSQVNYILAEDENISARAALKKSQVMMVGHKFEYLLLQLSMLGWHVLSILSFGILYIWTMPFIQAANVNFYQKVKADGEVAHADEKLADDRTVLVSIIIVEAAIALMVIGARMIDGSLGTALLGSLSIFGGMFLCWVSFKRL